MKYIGMVTYGNAKYTKLALETIKRSEVWKSGGAHLYVVVGKPGDEETLNLLSGLDNCTIREDANNMGFPNGLNWIYRSVFVENKSDYLLVMGNDTIPFPGSIDRLLQVSEEERLDYLGGKEIPVSMYFKRNPQYRVYFEMWKDGMGEFPLDYLEEIGSSNLLQHTPKVNGYHNFAVIGKAYFDKVGYVDENFFPAYYEDVDIVRRGTLAGLKHLELTNALYIHFRSVTLTQEHKNVRQDEWFTMNAMYYNRKWGGSPGNESNVIPFAGADAKISPMLKVSAEKYANNDTMEGVQEYYRWSPRFYKGLHSGQRAIIVGGGPSVRDLDTSLITDEIVIGLNRIYLKDDLHLSYLVAVNGQVLKDYGTEIVEVPVSATFISSAYGMSYGLWRPHVYGLWFEGRIKFDKDIEYPIYQGHTVTYCAMQIAHYMGIRDVCLLGIDHNYPRAEGHETNKPIESVGLDLDHFDPDYFPAGNIWETPNLPRSEESYGLAKVAFEEDGGRIVNCTPGTKLDVFEKMELEKWLKK